MKRTDTDIYNSTSKSLTKFIQSVSITNKKTAYQYNYRILFFEKFLKQQYQINLDELIQKINISVYNVYDILNDYCLFLNKNYNIGPSAFRYKLTTVKNFLEYHDIEISPRKFKVKIRIPKNIVRHKEALDKEEIIKILHGCSDLRLKTYVMLLASTGLRATEALSIRLKDLDIESEPAKLTIRGEYTKTKVDRYVFLTKEITEQFERLIDFKYRKRRICNIDKKTGKTKSEYRIPEKKPTELLFSINRTSYPKPEMLYIHLGGIFSKTLDRIGMGKREDGNELRRQITLHSFRRFVKSTISDLGYQDYSEWFIGHSGSTYWRKKDNEKAEIFKKIEPYLTFLDIQQLERRGADMETRIEELEETVQVYRTREQEREEKDRKHREWLTKMEKRFNELTAKFDMERDEKGHIKRIKKQ